MTAKPVSEILSAYADIKTFSEQNRSRLNLKVAELKKARRELMKRAVKAGLKLRESNFPDALDDIFETDDAGKLIDAFFKVKVTSIEEVQAAVTFCKDEKILALPIGAKTSALGVFEARALAERFGLKGIIGIAFDTIAGNEVLSTPPLAPRITLPPPPPEYTEVIWADSEAIAILHASNAAESLDTPPLVVAHAGCTISDINTVLEKSLSSNKIRFRLMPDPTSRADAQIGGTIATGAEGGNRTQPAEDISAVTVVDANGQKRYLTGEAAKNIVGLNGNAGVVCQAEFLASAFPKHEYGIFIPITGQHEVAWKHVLAFQDSVKSLCYSAYKNPRIQIGRGDGGTIVTGIELLSKNALEIAIKESEDRFEWIILDMMEGSDMGIFLTFSSFYGIHDELLFAEPLLTQHLRFDAAVAETDEHDNFIVNNNPLFQKLRFLSGAELVHMDSIRHSAPSHSRELARKMGGVTESTDINIRFHATDPESSKKALDSVASLYAKYAASFTKESGFQVSTYGHLHPGVGIGGGIDPHVRAIFELSNPGSRYNAPEQVSELKRRHNTLVRNLLQLHGVDGIEILPPEKSRFASSEYWNWYCLTNPESARIYLELCVELGIASSETGDQLATIAGRIPHVLPGILRPLRNGVLGLLDPAQINEHCKSTLMKQYHPALGPYWNAILNLCQEHHKNGKIRRLLSHTLLRAQEYFSVPNSSYVFFIESPDEATHILNRNFGSAHAYTVVPITPKPNEPIDAIEPEKIYSLDLSGFQIPEGLALLVVPHSAIHEAYKQQALASNRAVFRNLYEMWVSWPFDTLESPHIPAIAALGLMLDEKNWSYQRTLPTHQTISAEAGPTLLHQSMFANPEATILNLQTGIGTFKDFLGISQEYEIGFASSATQCMQLLSDALSECPASINVVQVVNDTSSERFNAVLRKGGIKVTTITSSWTTGENSQLNEISEKIIANFRKDTPNILLITPHKTTTTADVHPDHIIKKLSASGFMMGLHYHLICDITSGVGARNYATLLSPDSGLMRMPFTGCIGACNRALGVPSGIAFVALSPSLLKTLGISKSGNSQFTLASRFQQSREGTVALRWGTSLLIKRITASVESQQTVAQIEAECRLKMNLVLGWLEQHHDLIALVPNAYDRSPLIMGIFSQAKNMIVTKRLLNEIFGIQVGSGYGPFEREGIRLYIPMLSYEQVTEMLASLDVVLQLDDVVFSRGENIPNIALREPHDPLAVISRVAESCTVDDIIKDQLGLDWLGRLIQTFNANVASNTQKIQLGGKIPHISTGHHAKAQIYGESSNLREMRKILHLRNEETKLELTFHYQLYKETESHLRGRILGVPTATWADDDFCPAITYLLSKAREHLTEISRLLRKYVDGYSAPTTGVEIKASRDPQGRVEWPIVA